MGDRDFTREDIELNRTWAALGYLVFFLPLIKCKNSKLGRYCANQGLILLIINVLVSALFGIFGIVPLIGWIFELVGHLVSLFLWIIALMCMIQLMTNDRVIELPYVGFIRLIRP